MARTLLRELSDWKLQDESQDLRGRTLKAPDGRSLGTIDGLVADTETRRVESVVLDNGAEYPVRDIEIRDGGAVLGSPRTARSTGSPAPATDGRATEEVRIPVIEERIEVSKRPVVEGGVSVHTGVSEKPVSEDVKLRRTDVSVERHKVDREATPEDIQASKRNLDAIETSEEPVARKSARVVEEVVVSKHTSEKTANVKDTVRRTDVDVENLDSEAERNRSRKP